MATFTHSQHMRRGRPMRLAGAALLAAALGGLGVWQAAIHSHNGSATIPATHQPVAQAPVQHTVIAAALPASGAALSDVPATLDVVFVGSAEQAAVAQQGIDAANDLRKQMAVSEANPRVVAVTSAAETDGWQQMVAVQSAFPVPQQIPQLTLNDLRTSTAGNGATASQDASVTTSAASTAVLPRQGFGGPMVHVLLTASDEGVAALQQMLAAAAVGQGQADLAGTDIVLKVSANTSVADVMKAFGFENEQRLARGLSPIQVQDLR